MLLQLNQDLRNSVGDVAKRIIESKVAQGLQLKISQSGARMLNRKHQSASVGFHPPPTRLI